MLDCILVLPVIVRSHELHLVDSGFTTVLDFSRGCDDELLLSNSLMAFTNIGLVLGVWADVMDTGDAVHCIV